MEKEVYIVGITNGILKKELEIVKDGEWVTDEKSALDMAATQINHHWEVVRIINVKDYEGSSI